MNKRDLRTLWALCTMAVLAAVATAPPTQAAPPEVVCVPWYPSNLAISHDTWSGKTVTLKGTAHDPDGDADLATYEWDFGDGSTPASGTVTNPYIIEASHAYNGDIGDIFVATLTVTDTGGQSASDSYLVTIRNGSILSVKVNVAIDEGLWRLHKDMNRGTYADGTDYGYWSFGSYSASATGVSIEAFEIHGHLLTGDAEEDQDNAKEDPYLETVQRGLNYLLAQMHVHTISMQTAGDPDDPNHNGIGIGCYTESGHSMYECGITLMTFASSKAPGMVAATGPVDVVGRSYGDIVQDMVDYLAYGQTDSGSGRGGWRYYANYGQSDNSCSQWPTIGMEAAATTFGSTIPDFVPSELSIWIDYIQNDSSGGSGYSSPSSWVNVAKTGGLLCEMKFAGDNTTVARVQQALSYITAHWHSTTYDYGNLGDYYAMYSVMKGCSLLGVTTLTDGTDWYYDYANYLVTHQYANGSWPSSIRVSHPLTTAWAIHILHLTVVEPGPIADAGPDVNAHPPLIEVQFDGSGSYHLDASKDIVLYEWDFDGDGIYDFNSPDPTASYAYPAVTHPDGSIDWTATANVYTVVLRVTDNSSIPKTDTDECLVHITPPPWPPVSDPGGPYLAGKCEPITLDGSASYAPGGRLYPDPDHPWYGELISWEWDLDNDGEYDDATGPTVEWSSCDRGLYVVGLKVTDNWDDWETKDTVINVGNRPPVADAGGPYSCAVGAVPFDGSGSTDPDEGETETLEYRWDFDNNGIYDTDWSSSPTVTYKYPGYMHYTVKLQVRDTDGATDTDTADVFSHLILEVSSSAGGVAEIPGEGTFYYDYGETAQLLAKVTDPLFEFLGWRGSFFSSRASETLVMTANHHVRATFASFLDVIYVDDDAAGNPIQNGTPEHPFDAIWKGIEVARAGATVVVKAGRYYENVLIENKSITVTSIDPNGSTSPEFPVIHGNYQGPVVSIIQHDDTLGTHAPDLIGLILTGGKSDSGGALLCINSSPLLRNCLIVGNRSMSNNGGALLLRNSHPTLVNCTVTDNYVRGYAGGAIHCVDSNLIVCNSIVGNNQPVAMRMTGDSKATITFCNVEGGCEGQSNLDVDPMFVMPGYWADPAHPEKPQHPALPNTIWVDGDYHLSPGSLCIDAGDNSNVADEPSPNGDRINLGVYGGTDQATVSN